MSLFLKAPLKKAESARRTLYSKGVFDSAREIQRDRSFIYFPVLKKFKIKDCSVVERRGRKKIKKPASLAEALPGVDGVPSSFDVVGDVAILEFEEKINLKNKRAVAAALLKIFSNIKVVVEKSAKVSGRYRVRGVAHLAGERRTSTLHREHGCVFKVDVARDYFSPRLGTERLRVARQVKEGERVLVLFAGVGPYAILISKKRKLAEVVAVELNPHAVSAMKENARLNKTEVKIFKGDAKKVTAKLGNFDRVIMPLPKDAGDFLKTTLPALKKGGIVNFYTFARNARQAREELKAKLADLKKKARVLRAVECGSYSPCLSRFCVDFKLL